MSFRDYIYTRQRIAVKPWHKEPLTVALCVIYLTCIVTLATFTYLEFFTGGSPITAPFQGAGKAGR